MLNPSYKIYADDAYILLQENPALIDSSDEPTEALSNFLLQAIILLENKQLSPVCVGGKNVAKLFEVFKNHYRVVEAAGGIVRNEHDEILLIQRNGKWDLPKGKVEKGEDWATAARREVEEETGLRGLTQVETFQVYETQVPTLHTYTLHGQRILKPTYWFTMQCSTADNEHLTPQTEEGITAVRWVAAKNLMPYIQDTYASIRDILKKIN